MSERAVHLLLDDILESGRKIIAFVEGFDYESFVRDEKTHDAVVLNFEIIGEAASQLPQSFREAYPDIEWRRIRGFRNRLVHTYFGIDYGIVWSIIQDFLPGLLRTVETLRSQTGK